MLKLLLHTPSKDHFAQIGCRKRVDLFSMQATAIVSRPGFDNIQKKLLFSDNLII